MRILILGIDGYIGWPLANHLLGLSHEIAGLDNYSRRRRVTEIGSNSLIPIPHPLQRREWMFSQKNFIIWRRDSLYQTGIELKSFLDYLQPDAIVHLAEQPSAPWSMIDTEHAIETQRNNVLGTLNLLWAMKETCPEAHLLKLGSMGEYGTPNCNIPEGAILDKPCSWLPEDDFGSSPTSTCPMAGLQFPRSPGSFYHLSKAHDSHNIIFACNTWGLRSTDVMQGVVFGIEDNTRFDYDQYFGTVLNRFCTQAIIGMPLTIYGAGDQTRGFLSLKDSLQCLTLALENPPERGEYRVFNQFESIYSINQLASTVVKQARNYGLQANTNHLSNPRVEKECHYYQPVHEELFNLGYIPTIDMESEVGKLIGEILPYREMVRQRVIEPTTLWRY